MKTRESDFYRKETKESEIDQVSYLSKLNHELKTPIHGIQGVATHLIENWVSTDENTKKQCINLIIDASNQLLELISNISNEKLNQTQIDFYFTEEDLIETTKSIVDNFKNTYLINSPISCQINTEIDEFVSKIDKFWYKQLLTNLLANALNYSNSGLILVTMHVKKIDEIENLFVSVKDEGVGIPPSEVATIFTPYNRSTRTNTNTKGTGLGLSICKEVIVAHAGTIKAKNNEKIGSTIEFSIPKIIMSKK